VKTWPPAATSDVVQTAPGPECRFVEFLAPGLHAKGERGRPHADSSPIVVAGVNPHQILDRASVHAEMVAESVPSFVPPRFRLRWQIGLAPSGAFDLALQLLCASDSAAA